MPYERSAQLRLDADAKLGGPRADLVKSPIVAAHVLPKPVTMKALLAASDKHARRRTTP